MATKRMMALKNLTKEELLSKVRETEAQLFQVRLKKVTGQLADTATLWRLKKDIAFMRTRLSAAQK